MGRPTGVSEVNITHQQDSPTQQGGEHGQTPELAPLGIAVVCPPQSCCLPPGDGGSLEGSTLEWSISC